MSKPTPRRRSKSGNNNISSSSSSNNNANTNASSDGSASARCVEFPFLAFLFLFFTRALQAYMLTVPKALIYIYFVYLGARCVYSTLLCAVVLRGWYLKATVFTVVCAGAGAVRYGSSGNVTGSVAGSKSLLPKPIKNPITNTQQKRDSSIPDKVTKRYYNIEVIKTRCVPKPCFFGVGGGMCVYLTRTHACGTKWQNADAETIESGAAKRLGVNVMYGALAPWHGVIFVPKCFHLVFGFNRKHHMPLNTLSPHHTPMPLCVAYSLPMPSIITAAVFNYIQQSSSSTSDGFPVCGVMRRLIICQWASSACCVCVCIGYTTDTALPIAPTVVPATKRCAHSDPPTVQGIVALACSLHLMHGKTHTRARSKHTNAKSTHTIRTARRVSRTARLMDLRFSSAAPVYVIPTSQDRVSPCRYRLGTRVGIQQSFTKIFHKNR